MSKQIFILLLLPLLIIAQGFTAEKNSVIYSKGNTFIVSEDGQKTSLKKDDEVLEGDQLITEEHSFIALRLKDNSVIKIEPLSNIRLQKISKVIQKKTFGLTEILLEKGRLFFDVPNPDKKEVLRIKSKSVSLGVRGTRFFVAKEENNDLWAGVNEGEVEIKDKTRSDHAGIIMPGHAIKVEKNKTFTKALKYDWLNDIDYQVGGNEGRPSGFRKSSIKRKNEFKSKRKNWKFNKQRYAARKKIWKSRSDKFKRNNRLLLNQVPEILKQRLEKQRDKRQKRQQHFKLRKQSQSAKKSSQPNSKRRRMLKGSQNKVRQKMQNRMRERRKVRQRRKK